MSPISGTGPPSRGAASHADVRWRVRRPEGSDVVCCVVLLLLLLLLLMKRRAEAELKSCGPLPTIDDVVTIQDNDSFVVGDTVHISCRRGYTPHSHPPSRDVTITSSHDDSLTSLTVTCLDNLTWSTPQQVCHSTCHIYLFITGPPIHNVGGTLVTVAGVCSRLSSSVTRHGGRVGGFTRAGQAMTSCRLQSNTVTLHSGPVVLSPVRATP